MRSISAFLSTALLTLSVAGTVFAQPQAPAQQGDHGRQHHRFNPARMAERMDVNHNGRIELAELPEALRVRIAPADVNRDGILAPEELRAHFQARRAEMQAQMDTNRDGTVSPEERTAAHEARRAARFARIDTNGDGAVTQAEAGEARWSRIGRADANNDGRVTREELQSAHRGRGEGHRGPGAGCGQGARRGHGNAA